MAGRLVDYIAQGLAASLPDPATIDVALTAGAHGFYYATDTQVLYNLDRSGTPAWDTLSQGANAIDDLSDVDTSTIAPTDGQVLIWSAADSEWQPGDVASGGGGGGGGGLSEGTSFPGSPSTGDRFRRTDLDYMVFFYDGTRWLSEQLHSLNLSTPNGGSTSNDNQYWPVPGRANFGLFMVDFITTSYRTTSGQWDWLLRYSESGGALNLITTRDGSADSNATWNDETIAIDAVLSADARALNVRATEISGFATFLGAATLTYRLIAT